MAITGNKFEAYDSIKGTKSLYVPGEKNLKAETIIRIAKEEYDVNLTKNDIEEMIKRYKRYLNKYRFLF